MCVTRQHLGVPQTMEDEHGRRVIRKRARARSGHCFFLVFVEAFVAVVAASCFFRARCLRNTRHKKSLSRAGRLRQRRSKTTTFSTNKQLPRRLLHRVKFLRFAFMQTFFACLNRLCRAPTLTTTGIKIKRWFTAAVLQTASAWLSLRLQWQSTCQRSPESSS